MDLLTQPQSAEFTGLSQRSLERHRRAGTGPKFVRLGRRVFYRRADLEAWVAECTYGSTSEANSEAPRRVGRAVAKSADKNADPSAQASEKFSHPRHPLPGEATPIESRSGNA